jgi:UDP-N-acetylglucosamine acyltransferase
MGRIDPTAIIDGDIVIAASVVIGPHCVLRGPIEIAPGNRLLGNVYLQGPLRLGENNTLYPFSCIGFAPQALSVGETWEGAGVAIGSHNILREHVTIHRATSASIETTLGDHNYLMAGSHVGHDSRVGNHCVFANGTLLGGHVHIGASVVSGGHATVHQHCRVGRGAMLSGSAGLSRDLPPFFTLSGINIAGSINLVGMRRSGMPREQIEQVRWVYRTLYRQGLTPAQARQTLQQRAGESLIDEYIGFLHDSQRGICPARADPRRNK